MMALLCGGIAAVVLIEMILLVFDPLWSVTNVQCSPSGCNLSFDLLRLLGPAPRPASIDIPAIEATLQAGIQENKNAALLAIAEIIKLLPRFAFYIVLGGAMLQFRDPKQFNHGAIRWLRYAAIAAIVIVLSNPLALSVRETVIQSILGNGDGLRLSIVGSDLPFDIFLVGILWVSIWALEEGRRVQNELAEYV